MKKTLISLVALMMAAPAFAYGDCAYSPLQNLIRNVRDAKEITDLMTRGVAFNEETRCGGSLMQLAILRGNPQVLKVLIQKNPEQIHKPVKLDAYPIPGARGREIPLILFAAYYAPNPQMIELLINEGKADISKTDEEGKNLLWYMDMNPVLRNTALSDTLNDALLYSLAPSQQGRQLQIGKKPTAPTQNASPEPTALPGFYEDIQPTEPSVVEAQAN